MQRWFPGTEWGVFVRDYLQDVYAEEHPGASVNDIRTPQTQASLFINGQWLPEHRIPSDGAQHVAGFVDGTLAWVWVQPDEAAAFEVDDLPQMLATIARSKHTIDAGGRIIDRPWDLVAANAQQLIDDFSDEGVSQAPQQPHVQCLGAPRDVYVSPEAAIDPYVVLDTRHGPISISKGAHVQSFTRIEGPCHIARESQIFRALIHGGTTIGPVCRVGGEVEESILQAFVNKYHEGFLGHSYVCPWVNLGAISTTSDLKSDYSTVSVPLEGTPVETGLIKVGSFIGDHSKTAIDSMFNTGSAVGVMAMVLPGGRLLPRHIPSFCNISFGELASDSPLEVNLQTARMAMARRGCEFTPAAEELFRFLHRATAHERQRAMERATGRISIRSAAPPA